MGENGAGKSTDDEMSHSERIRKTKGLIILGRQMRDKFHSAPKEALENGVAMVHQELNQCLERSVIDNLFLGRYPKNSLGVVDEEE